MVNYSQGPFDFGKKSSFVQGKCNLDLQEKQNKHGAHLIEKLCNKPISGASHHNSTSSDQESSLQIRIFAVIFAILLSASDLSPLLDRSKQAAKLNKKHTAPNQTKEKVNYVFNIPFSANKTTLREEFNNISDNLEKPNVFENRLIHPLQPNVTASKEDKKALTLSTLKETQKTDQNCSQENPLNKDGEVEKTPFYKVVKIEEPITLHLQVASCVNKVVNFASRSFFTLTFGPVGFVLFSKPVQADVKVDPIDPIARVNELREVLLHAVDNTMKGVYIGLHRGPFDPLLTDLEISTYAYEYESLKKGVQEGLSLEGKIKPIARELVDGLESYHRYKENNPVLAELALKGSVLSAKTALGYEMGGPRGAAIGVVEGVGSEVLGTLVNEAGGETLEKVAGFFIDGFASRCMRWDSTLENKEAAAFSSSILFGAAMLGEFSSLKTKLLTHSLENPLYSTIRNSFTNPGDLGEILQKGIHAASIDNILKEGERKVLKERLGIDPLESNSHKLSPFERQKFSSAYEGIKFSKTLPNQMSSIPFTPFTPTTQSFQKPYLTPHVNPHFDPYKATSDYFRHESYLQWKEDHSLSSQLRVPTIMENPHYYDKYEGRGNKR